MGLRPFLVLGVLSVVVQACDCRGKPLAVQAGDLSVNPQALDFGTVLKGAVVPKTVKATNGGKVPVSVESVRIEADPRGVFSTAEAPFVLEPGASRTLTVKYTAPAAGGGDSAFLVLAAGAAEARVTLDGFSLVTCPQGTSACDGVCVDLQTNPNHCGTCNAVCSACVAGACQCLKKQCGNLQCGSVSDGCGGTLDCGACPVADAGVPDAGTTVDAGIPDAGVCVPVSCPPAACGVIPNGCGGTRDCGGCGANEACQSNACVPTCVPATCQSAGAACGSISNGCGGSLSCGGCTNGNACTGNQCVCPSTTEICGNGVDDNCDGNVDCVDPQCLSLPACAQQPCAVTDPEVQITNSNDPSNGAAILWTGTHYGLFWMNAAYRYGFARLDSSLALVTQPVLVTGTSMAHRPFPVWTGTQYGIGWSDTRAGALQYSNEVYFNRFNATTGVPMTGTDLGVSTGPGMAFPSSTGWNPVANEFGVLFADEGTAVSGGNQRRMTFQRVDASGALVGPKQKVSPAALTDGTGDYGHLAWGGSTWGAAWTEIRNGVGPHIWFSRLTPAGVPEPVDTQVSAGASYGYFPRVAAGGTSFGVAYTDVRGPPPAGGNIWFQRFDTTGAGASTSRAVTSSGKARNADVVWAGTHWALVYGDARGGYERIYYAKLDVDGNKVGAEQLLSCQTKQAMAPSVTWDGTKLVVAFSYLTGQDGQVYVKRFSP